MAFPLVVDPTHGVATYAEAVLKSDATVYNPCPLYIFVGTGGDVTIDLAGGDTTPVLFKNVPSGSLLPISCRRIMAVGTTALDFVLLS